MNSSEHLAEYHHRRPIALSRSGREPWLDEAKISVMPATEIEVSYNGGPQPS